MTLPIGLAGRRRTRAGLPGRPLLGDPRRCHPVAGFGAAGRLAGGPGRTPTDRTAGVRYVAVLVGATAGSGVG